MRYTIQTSCTYDPEITSVTYKRFDHAVYALHKAIFEACEAQGMRDTKTAWNCLSNAHKLNKSIWHGALFPLGAKVVSTHFNNN